MTHQVTQSKVIRLVPLLLFAPAGAASAQQDMQFPDATETVPELVELYSAADSICRLSKSRDVKVKVACVARALYGTALNERNRCYGKKGEANATMQWHACGATSLRFPAMAGPTL